MSINEEQSRKALKNALERKNRGGSRYVSKVFLPNDAIVYFRPLADGGGNFYAEKKRHQIIGDEKIEIACTGAGCAVCAKLEELSRWANKWQFQARPVTFGYGVITHQMG